MREVLHQVLLAVAAATSFCVPAAATSIIVEINPDRIIVLADSRAELLNPKGNTTRDDKCKIVMLDGHLVFTETGNEGYTPEGIFDPLREWHGTDEAIKASGVVSDHDLYKVALAWAIQVTSNFQRFYLTDPQRVRQLALRPGPLLVGLFAGKDAPDHLEVYIVKIALDDNLPLRERTSVPIGYSIDRFPLRGAPASTNRVTQELLDGKTDRAKRASELWAEESVRISKADQDDLANRRLAFLIEQTGNYDSEVHGPVNAVQVTLNSVSWLWNNTCRVDTVGPR